MIMRREDIVLPAIVRPAEDLATLAQEANRQHAAGVSATRKGVEHLRACGHALKKAKAQCGHGKWLEWLKDNVQFDRRTATRYMQLAEIPEDKWDTVSHLGLSEALRVLAEDHQDEAPASGSGTAPRGTESQTVRVRVAEPAHAPPELVRVRVLTPEPRRPFSVPEARLADRPAAAVPQACPSAPVESRPFSELECFQSWVDQARNSIESSLRHLKESAPGPLERRTAADDLEKLATWLQRRADDLRPSHKR
jgi:hypothetical protein